MTLHTGSRSAAVVGALAVSAALGCSDIRPTEPTAPRLVMSDSLATSLRVVLDDARLRVLPGLSSEPRTARLGSTLASMAAAIDGRDRRAFEMALNGADAALADYAEPSGAARSEMTPAGSGDQAELDVVRLALDHARAAARNSANVNP